MMRVFNGVIRDFDLVIEDHGIFTFSLLIEMDYVKVNKGFYKFPDGKLEAFVHDLMELLEVHEAKKIRNSFVRFTFDEYGNLRLGHIFKDKWLNYKDYMKG